MSEMMRKLAELNTAEINKKLAEYDGTMSDLNKKIEKADGDEQVIKLSAQKREVQDAIDRLRYEA